MEPARLADGDLVLDGLTAGDVGDLVALDDERAQWAFMRGRRTPESAAKLVDGAYWQWSRGSVRRRWAIRLAGQLAGTIILFPNARRPGSFTIEAELGATFRGQGVGRRALALVCGYAFDVAGAAELEIETRMGNAAAQKAAIAVGFEGVDELRSTAAGDPMTVGRLTLERWRDAHGLTPPRPR